MDVPRCPGETLKRFSQELRHELVDGPAALFDDRDEIEMEGLRIRWRCGKKRNGRHHDDTARPRIASETTLLWPPVHSDFDNFSSASCL
jgi:hypothetical protein